MGLADLRPCTGSAAEHLILRDSRQQQTKRVSWQRPSLRLGLFDSASESVTPAHSGVVPVLRARYHNVRVVITVFWDWIATGFTVC